MLLRKRAHLSKNFAAFQAQYCNKNTCNTTSMLASVHFQQGVPERTLHQAPCEVKMNKKAWESEGGERERKEVGGGGGRLREDD